MVHACFNNITDIYNILLCTLVINKYCLVNNMEDIAIIFT